VKSDVVTGKTFLKKEELSSVVAKVKISKGTVLTLDMLGVKVAEPMGIPAGDIFQLVGKTVNKNVEEDDSVLPNMVDNYVQKAGF
uniref:Ice-structuring protein n=1 Tax=Fundulus heteroclitus TaxID=8078 RepID=A0A3Q2QWR0_FUNHE